MKRIEKMEIKLEEHEIGALEMLSKVECKQITLCFDCPFNLNVNIRMNTGEYTRCLSLLCGDIADKEKRK